MSSEAPPIRLPREQVNLVLTAGSPLARRLREAERATGRPRTQIVRGVLDAFIEAWTEAELARQQAFAAARSAAVVPVRRLGRMRPQYVEAARPAPGYAEAVAARQPLPPPLVTRHVDLPTRRGHRRPVARTPGVAAAALAEDEA